MGFTSKHLIETQIPGHIRESNPLFTKFLEYYYEFVNESNITDIIQEIKKYNDIDAVGIEFLTDFFEEFKKIPKNIVADQRLVAKHIYDLYQSKGSEDSLKLLFKIVYGETIAVTYPSEQILRASDGRWIQDNLVTTRDIEGAVTPGTNRIKIISTQGTFEFELRRIDTDLAGYARFYFDAKKPYHVDDEQLILVYENDDLVYTGKIVIMPSVVEIEDGGSNWQVGQVLVLPGPIKDTLCQVKRVSPGGAITNLEIVDYGYGYEQDEVFVISPYPYKPSAAYYESSVEKISDSPEAYAHTLNIFDFNDGLGENILGMDSDQTYILEGYVLRDYINRRSIVQTYYIDQSSDINNDEITISQWVESRARIRLKNLNNARAVGFYEDFRGQLSAPDIRLQDNFYYQLFSYVIETAHMISDYKKVLELVHPAGMKYFSNYSLTVPVQTNITVNRILSRELLLLDDQYGFTDVLNSAVVSNKATPVVVTDVDVQNNYDANNELVYYDPAVDWDELTAVVPYDGQEYDSQYYGETAETNQNANAYTEEGPAIVVTKN